MQYDSHELRCARFHKTNYARPPYPVREQINALKKKFCAIAVSAQILALTTPGFHVQIIASNARAGSLIFRPSPWIRSAVEAHKYILQSALALWIEGLRNRERNALMKSGVTRTSHV